MPHFIPQNILIAYRPGSDKTLENLLRFSPVNIKTVVAVQCEIPEMEQQRYLAFNPKLTFLDSFNKIDVSNIDTLLWTREVFENELDYQSWRKSIHWAIEHRLNIYNLARLYTVSHQAEFAEEARAKSIKFWDASLSAFPYCQTPMHGEIVPPAIKACTILVLGTERRCGKFTTTQVLRQRLDKNGHKTAELATEPYGLLTGANEVIIPQMLPMWQATPTVNKMVAHLDQIHSPDYIFVSSQSGLRARGLDAAGRCGGIVAYTIALGSMPDICILSSKQTTIAQISRERHIIELLLGKPVLGISIYQKTKPDTPFDTFPAIQNSFDIPVFDPLAPDGQLDDIINAILNFTN